jgi:hypothetical protein
VDLLYQPPSLSIVSICICTEIERTTRQDSALIEVLYCSLCFEKDIVVLSNSRNEVSGFGRLGFDTTTDDLRT